MLIFESSNITALAKNYESTESVSKAGDKASDTNYAKHHLALQDLNEGKKWRFMNLVVAKRIIYLNIRNM